MNQDDSTLYNDTIIQFITTTINQDVKTLTVGGILRPYESGEKFLQPTRHPFSEPLSSMACKDLLARKYSKPKKKRHD